MIVCPDSVCCAVAPNGRDAVTALSSLTRSLAGALVDKMQQEYVAAAAGGIPTARQQDLPALTRGQACPTPSVCPRPNPHYQALAILTSMFPCQRDGLVQCCVTGPQLDLLHVHLAQITRLVLVKG